MCVLFFTIVSQYLIAGLHKESVMKTVSSFSTRKLSGVGIKRHKAESTRNLEEKVNGDAANFSFGHKKG